MDVAVIGAAGACGRQLAMQLLERRVQVPGSRLQLVGRRGGPSEHELWGLRADLRDAFDDWAPTIEVVFDPEEVSADIVVMMAGRTVSADPGASQDRAQLAAANAALFRRYAEALGRQSEPPVVIVQSNPVEVAVGIFAEHLHPQRVIGAGAWSDSLRFAREIASDLGVSRRDVLALMLGQHGDHLVPVWSQVSVRGVPDDVLVDYLSCHRTDRPLVDLPTRIRSAKATMLSSVRAGQVRSAFAVVEALPADERAAVKPFFTHFTAGRTTEAVTARAACDMVAALISGVALAMPAQVVVAGRWAERLGLSGVLGVPVILGRDGWAGIVPVELSDEEQQAMHAARDAVAAAATAAAGAATATATAAAGAGAAGTG